MIPVLSSEPVSGLYEEKMSDRRYPLVAYRQGGPVLGSDSLFGTQWTLTYQNPEFVLTNESGFSQVLLSATGVTYVSLCFTQTMSPIVSYVSGGNMFMYWFDPTVNQYVTMALGPGTTPYLCIDERRKDFISSSDVLISYIRDSNLYCRVQRERFLIEHLLQEQAGNQIVSLGKTDMNRLEWRLVPLVQ